MAVSMANLEDDSINEQLEMELALWATCKAGRQANKCAFLHGPDFFICYSPS